MKYLSLFLFVALFFSCDNSRVSEKDSFTGTGFFIGGYTAEGKPDIYSAQLNEDGSIGSLKALAYSGNASWLEISSDRKYMLAVNEYFEDPGKFTVYAIQKDSLIKVDDSESYGMYPCYIELQNDSTGYIANYGGSVSMFRLRPDMTIDTVLSRTHEGSSQNQDRQTSAHPHMSSIWKERNCMIVPDLGTDELVIYSLDSLNEMGRVKMTPGAGPRLITFKDKNNVYVINELNSSVSHLRWNDELFLETVSEYSTLPSDFSEKSYAAGIQLNGDKTKLYVSNRGHNSIAVFDVNTDGTLSLSQIATGDIDWPRNFTLSPDEKFLLVANQKGNSIAVFHVDPSEGILTDSNFKLEVPSPTRILF